MDSSAPQDKYLLELKFRNNLPSAPSGPFLKTVQVVQSLSEFPEYCTSTLEKNYIWQPHFGPGLGIKLDLVDQEAILAQDKAGLLDQADLKYLMHNTDKGRGKAKHIEDSDKPWWLRNTTYMENNLYNVAKVKSKAALAAEIMPAKRPAVDYDRDMLTTSFINESFVLVSKTVAALVAKNGTNKLLNDLPLVPLTGEALNGVQIADRMHSLVRFDEDPLVSGINGGGEEGYSSSSSNAPAGKRRRVDTGLITNLRQTQKVDGLRSESLEVSLVSPLVVSGGSAQSQSSAEEGAAEGKEEREVRYGWVKDYRMEVNQLQDSFLFVVRSDALGTAAGPSASANGNNNGNGQEGGAGAVQYLPVRARVEMHNVNPEDARPHDCLVVPE